MPGRYQRTGQRGSRPGQYQPSAGYAYGNEVSQGALPYGYEGGFGIVGGAGTANGGHIEAGLLQGSGFVGARSEDDGTAWHGAGAHGKVAGLSGGYGQSGSGGYIQGGADAFGFDAEASVNPDRGAQLGAGAYIVQGAVEGGYNNAQTNQGGMARLGVGAGVGAAGRLHWGDEDGDGFREYGLGADIGPVSFDLKSEDPLMALANGVSFGAAGALAGPGTNLTSSAVNAVSSAGSAIGSAASSAWDWATDW